MLTYVLLLYTLDIGNIRWRARLVYSSPNRLNNLVPPCRFWRYALLFRIACIDLICHLGFYSALRYVPLSVIKAEVDRENALLLSVSDYFQEIVSEENISNAEINEWIFENGSNFRSEDVAEVEEIDSSDDNAVEIVKHTRITHQTAIESYNNCIQWAKDNGMDLKDILMLQNHRETAVQRHISIKRHNQKYLIFLKRKHFLSFNFIYFGIKLQ